MLEPTRPVLITGGAGFAGSYVIRSLLDQGYRVVTYDRDDYRSESRFVIGPAIDEVAFERGSIDDWPRVLDVFLRHRPTAVVHAGGVMDPPFLSEHPTIALQVNVGGTLNFLEASRLVGGVERFVFLSSVAVIGRKLYEPIDANHPVVTATSGPLGAYGAAKVAAESFCFVYHQQFGVDIRIVRPSALYGFAMSWFAPNYVKNIVEPAVLGLPVKLASGAKVPRDYTHAADLASLVTAILQGPEEADRVFFAATGRPLRTASEVAAVVRQLVPGATIELGDAFSPTDLRELPIRGQYNIDNAREGLSWQPRFVDLHDGIADYIARFRSFIEHGGTPTPSPPGLLGVPGQGLGSAPPGSIGQAS
jgi:nucleoside-diphosphate-sugar epimerase